MGAATFTPSWLAYVLLLVYCVLSPLRSVRHAQAEQHNNAASSADTPYGGTDGITGSSRSEVLHTEFCKVAGIASGVLGWSLSQILLTLRLDALYKVSWLGIILPAFLGW